jgi:ABC-type nitrate/sulfonate/bicarbonate transport system permease component
VAWQIVGARISPIFLSTPTAIATAFVQLLGSGVLYQATLVTFWTFSLGLMAGVTLGSLLGILLGRYWALAASVRLIFRILYSIPIIALFPLFILWIGPGVELRLTSIFLASLLPALISSEAGVQSVDRSLLEAGVVFGARERELFWKIIVPATVPFVAAGFKVAIGRAIVTTVAVEILTSQSGLGGLMSLFGNQLQTANYFGALIIVAIISLSVFALGDTVEARFSRWRGP